MDYLQEMVFLYPTGGLYSAELILIVWGRVMHICICKLTIIGSDNGSSPGRRRAIIWTNTGILLIGPIGTNFFEFLIRIQIFSVKKMQLKMLSAQWCPFCLCLNVLTHWPWDKIADILQTTFSKCISFSVNFTPIGPIKSNATVVQAMAFHKTGNKPLCEAIMALFTDEI